MFIWRNLNISNSTIYSFIREPSKELEEHLGSAAPGLKNTAVQDILNVTRKSVMNVFWYKKTFRSSKKVTKIEPRGNPID